jgi:hypothetical protein
MKRLAIAGALLAAVSMTAGAKLTDGLVLYMSLDEGAGTTVADLGPNGLDGEIRGSATWVQGQYGEALQFAGSSDLVNIPIAPVLEIADEITQAAWVKLDQLPGSHAIVFGTRSDGGRRIGFGYGMNPSNGIKVWTNTPTGGFLDINDNATVLETNVWYYLAYTHTTDDSGMVRIYVDGVITHEQASNNPVAPAGTPTDVTIGTWGGEAWPGHVDEVRLWSRVLSDDEIVASMNADAEAFLGGVAVHASGKLATSWARVKAAR